MLDLKLEDKESSYALNHTICDGLMSSDIACQQQLGGEVSASPVS